MSEGEVPLSPKAQDAKEAMHHEFLRNMAQKMMAGAIEEERERRIKELKELQNPKADSADEDSVKKNAFEQLMVVQEDLVRSFNLMKVKAEAELEQAQRVTEGKKQQVHDELIRKSTIKEVDRAADSERERRIDEEKSEFNMERSKVYNKLVTVQEDLLKTFHRMKADEEVKLEQEHRILEGKKNLFQEELVHSVGEKVADVMMDSERTRRTGEISMEEMQRRITIGHMMIDVQKELIATHKLVKPIEGTVSQEVLEEAKAFYQEQLLRKYAQKEAVAAMDEEQKRRVSESKENSMSDPQVTILEQINRRSNVQKAKELVDNTQKEYIQAEVKARAQEETVRRVHQKQADVAMDKEKEERMIEVKEKPHISEDIKKDIQAHSK